jgi:hypothetical protein
VKAAGAMPRLIPLAKRGRTIVTGKCSDCGRQFTLIEGSVNGALANQFAEHTEKIHRQHGT